MLQRIQTVFLLIMAIAMLSMLFVPIWDQTRPETSEKVTLTAFYLTIENTATKPATVTFSKPTFYISILAFLSVVVSVYSITRYDNRLTQMKLGLLNSVIIIGALAASLIFAQKGADLIKPPAGANYAIGFFLPMLALLCNSMSNRFIRRDEKLVRDADRLR